MLEIEITNNYILPVKFTGIVSYKKMFTDYNSNYTEYRIHKYFLISGKIYKKTVSDLNGKIFLKAYFNKEHKNSYVDQYIKRVICNDCSFEEMFECLTAEEKEVVIWNFNIWSK